jgi:hypothetical protein
MSRSLKGTVEEGTNLCKVKIRYKRVNDMNRPHRACEGCKIQWCPPGVWHWGVVSPTGL